jgi:hypothetical protein
MKFLVLAMVLLGAAATGASPAGAAPAATAPAAAVPTAPAPAASAGAGPTSASVAIEIYRIAPGQHEAFLKFIALCDQVNIAAGVPARQLYVHQDGASWDFLLIQPEDYTPAQDAALRAAGQRLGLPTGANFFFEIRRYIAEHTDTAALGPTTAAAYLARTGH